MRTLISDLLKNYARLGGKRVTVCGWLRTVRDNKAFAFLELNDGTALKSVQIVATEGLTNFAEVVKLNAGAAVTVDGAVALTPENKQPFEVQAEYVRIEGVSPPEYPLQKKRHSLEFLREIAYLRPRTNTFNAVFRVRSVCAQAIHRFFAARRFVYVHTPIITGSDCEGAGEMFRVTTLGPGKAPELPGGGADFKRDFFGKPAALTVSGQLNAESYAMAFSNVYTFGPTFRAENSNTSRHAAEFWMIEPEIAFADLNDDMALAESMIKYIIKAVLRECPDETEFFNQFIDNTLLGRLNAVLKNKFGAVTYTEAVDLLLRSGEKFEYPVKWGVDLQSEHERYITEMVFGKPVFLIDYPKEIKAFYMRANDDNRTVAAMDLLVPSVGELIGGSQREERGERLLARIKEMNMNPADYDWYLNLRKFGGVRHAGFGMGFERLIMYMTGMSNIRDVIPFPRTAGNLEY
ncbi:MAG: asparagine--tRNA ligase [Clostridiales bacterium]|jgi:asparaginyl-tRNA synthetase|nr:asparagine--tRNA ligase [Clostridiales bacterium]